MARKFPESGMEFHLRDTASSFQKSMVTSSMSMSSRFSFAKSTTSGFSDQTPEELTVIIQKCVSEIDRLNIENEIFEKFISKVQPVGLSGMNQYLESASQLSHRVQSMVGSMALIPAPNYQQASSESSLFGMAKSSSRSALGEMGVLSSMSHYRSTIKTVGSSCSSSSGAVIKLTLGIRMEIVMHIIEDLRATLEQFLEECKATKFKYVAEIEEKLISLNEIKLARSNLEQSAASCDGVDSLITRVPAERFLRVMTDILKNYDVKIGKVRLKLSTIRTRLKQVKTQLVQKLELGEMIQPTDFDELRIENKEHAQNLELKNKYVVQLKQVAGICIHKLSVKRRNLFDSLDNVKRLAAEIEEKNLLSTKLAEEQVKAENEIKEAKQELRAIKNITMHYPAINTMDYIKRKADLREIDRNIHIWTRRINLQVTTINLLKHKLMTVTPNERKKIPKEMQVDKINKTNIGNTSAVGSTNYGKPFSASSGIDTL